MIGDKLLIRPEHAARARELVGIIGPRIVRSDRLTLAVCGESGAGKSELASEISRLVTEAGFPSAVIQQDDYFVYPPQMNSAMRRKNISQVGLYEVKLHCLDAALRSYKRGETSLYKPLILFDEDRIVTEELSVAGVRLLIAEGTYTGFLSFADIKVYIDRDYRNTRVSRKERGREKQNGFLEEILQIEHDIISNGEFEPDLVVTPDFGSLIQRTEPARREPSGGEKPQGGTL